jgi:hypothetical protein
MCLKLIRLCSLLAKFFKWGLILSFAVPAYIYSYSLTAFFENYGTLYSILKSIFGEGEYNMYIPKLDGMVGATIAISFSIFGYGSCFYRSIPLGQINNGRKIEMKFIETEKKFDPEEVYKGQPNPTKI